MAINAIPIALCVTHQPEPRKYTLTQNWTLKWIHLDWSITDSSGNVIGSGSTLASSKSGTKINKTYQVSPGTYTISYYSRAWVPCDENGMPQDACVCSDGPGLMGGHSKTYTVSVNFSNPTATIPLFQPTCGHHGCTNGLYTCDNGSSGIKPVVP